jgi:DNA-binding CsgD family transcriptional regulator
LLVIGIYRDPEVGLDDRHPLSDTLALLRRETDFQQITLRGLSYPEVTTYLAQSAREELPQALVQTIHTETGGNPFYVREVFRHLLEEDKIARRAGRWTTDFSMTELGIPAGVRQVLARRLSRLSNETNAVLRFAAAFTSGFNFQTLQSLTGWPDEALLDCLDEALRAGLIRPLAGRPPHYDFVHAMVRHTLYDGLNPDRKARLHRRIAEALQQSQTSQERDNSAELAFQYHASAVLPGAEPGIPFCLAAAEQAQANYAPAQAVMFLRMARDLAGQSPDASHQAEIFCQLAVAEARALLLAEAAPSVDMALAALAEAKAEAHAIAEFLVVVSRALKEGGADPTIWRPLVERGLGLIGEQKGLIWARLMLLLGRLEPITSEIIYVSRWLGYDPQAITIARADGDEADYAHTLEPLDWRSREETEAVLALARRWQRPAAILRALDVVARDLVYRHGDILAAVDQLQELYAAGERYGSIPAQAEALIQRALCQALLGDLAVAQQTLQQAREMVNRLGSVHRLRALALTAIESILADYLEGDWPRLAQEATRFATDPQTGQNPLGLTATNFAVFNQYRAGNNGEAHRLLAALTATLERATPTMYLYNGGVHMGGTTAWALAATEFAASYRRLALELLAAGLQGSPLRSNALIIARMAALLGNLDEAKTYFAQARDSLEKAGLRPLRAIVDYDEALALNRAGSTDYASIAALLETALAQFRALGMAGWEQRTLALKELSLENLDRPPGSPTSYEAPSPRPRYPGGLTTREVEVLRLIAEGHTNREIATYLVVSLPTVERHIANIYHKIGARNRAEATAYALNHGLA